MFWLLPVIAIGGVIVYLSSDDEKETNKTPLKKYELKKSELPSKIRFWDDVEGAKKSGKWESGAMPKEFRHYEKYNDVTKKWQRIDYSEYVSIESWGSDYDNDKYHYHFKKGKRSGKEGKYYVRYFTPIAKSMDYRYEE
jgi:hypothetical protein